MDWLSEELPPPLPFDDCALTAAAIRVRVLVLEEARPSPGALVVSRRPSPGAVPAPVDDPSGAAAPLEPLADMVPLLGWRDSLLSPC